ncbi:SAP domain-containing protein [Cyanobium gracile]|uniref:Rho termination factor n=1 Tax=Cyanobium gracile (strain ATCC 27147 / PCC 6307) TaxID=292564 RepID=K9P7D3_CYAGP|nr:Rho termination factor N-terminal domain-containing protein [Cyanobium gracile]AFY28853.1 Rho termination factor [Cyanobium gracile PCC 6307]
MGRIAEALRSNLRELAQADARLLRELDGALPTDGLEELTIKQLKERCRQRGLKGISSLRKAELILRLRDGPSAPASLPESKPTGLEARLDRMEALLLRIAAHLGVE